MIIILYEQDPFSFLGDFYQMNVAREHVYERGLDYTYKSNINLS